MTENEARFIAQRLFNTEELYIMLSVTNADMMNGYSVPYVGLLENGSKMLFVFTSYERAKAYIDDTGYEVLDGIYPIAKINHEDEYRNLYSICNIAAAMGIESIDFDLGCNDAFGCKIMWLLEVNDKKTQEVSIIVSQEEAQKLMEEGNQVPLRMNPMKIEEFVNPFVITEEQTERLFKHLFSQTTSLDDIKFNFENNQTLIENCFLADRINTRLIPQALNDEKESEANYFSVVSKMLETVVWESLFENKVYTMADKETGNIIVKNSAIYVVYTDRFKYMGPFEYVEIESKDILEKLIKDNNIEQLVVTDGPNYMCVLNRDNILK